MDTIANKDQKKKFIIEDDSTIIIDLHPNELQLLKALRTKWRFGEVTIMMRDGLPFRIRRVEEFLDFR